MRQNLFATLHFGFAFLLLSAVFFPPSQTRAATAIRMGVIGDSNSDEYRADDNRAGETAYSETTLSWVELLANNRDFDFGAWGKWGGERRNGYEYNWARSGATAESMIVNGQHTALAAQVQAGKIDYAVIFIGTNDFHSWNGTYEEVYTGKISGAQLEKKVDNIVSNITLAVDTLQAAGSVKIILTNYADPNGSADFMLRYTDVNKRQRVTDAIIQINQRLAELVTARGIVLADLYNFGSSVLSRVDAQGNIIVGGEAINAIVHGDEPHHLQLGAGVGHLGTVGSGLLANFYLTALSSYDLSVPLFTDEEILVNAGVTTLTSAEAQPLAVDAFAKQLEALKTSLLHLLSQ